MRSTPEEIEDGYVASDQDATRLAVFENTCVMEVTVQGAQNIGSANHGGMNDRVVVRIRWNDLWPPVPGKRFPTLLRP